MPATVDPGGLGMLHRYVLAAVGARGAAPVPDKLWLEKEIFLLAQTNPRLSEEADFVPYLKGPWSEALDIALEEMRTLCLVDFDKYGRQIRLTGEGKRCLEHVIPDMPEHIREHVEEVKDLLNDLNQDELLLFIYLTYPDMTTGSVVAERPIKNRVRLARSLYEKEKVSLEKAAELADLPLSKFRKLAEGAEA